ncbi:GDSL esterase/lipase [Pyrus ussuriensis x Pyrus communis]|uniref:GDSL esterase/lipase n=1 Tax=Pyrus ussuriensis x Pyrus communis TaxID=2448454 RepID=A0A5N5HUE7_9ROSA|nr:GDSL esterase/lipase [Pyrus ussuriensis x Pyrus communis]
MHVEIIKPFLWVFPILLLVSNLHYSCFVDGAPQVPCYFIFGDSLSDSGNNNGLLTLAKANYTPYGIDFPRGPTGRFSNGRNLVDVIAELLGFSHYIPPFATAIGWKILHGVNYASGAAGIRDESGRNQGMRVTFNEQLVNHQSIVRQIVSLQGNNNSATIQYLGKCIYTVAIGSNDYINNYFMPRLYPTSRQFTSEQYSGVLIQQYSGQIKTLYNSGARKIALFGLGTIGSIPFEVAMCNRSTNNVSLCSDNINSAVQSFNARLQSLVADLNSNLTDAKFTYIDFYGIGLSSAAASLGSVIFDAPCCEVVRETGLCVPFNTPCQNRTQYSFWDAIHPSESSNVVLGGRAYNATLPTDAVPFDINQLAQA